MRPYRILHEKLHTMFRSHVVPFQHISETTMCSRSISERTCRPGRLFVNCGKLATIHRLFAFPSRFGTAVARSSLPSSIFLQPFTLSSAIVRSSSPWREQTRNDPVILALIWKMTWCRNSLIGATSSPRLAWQVRSSPFSTQLITSLQGTQESRSGLISPIFFAMTLMTGADTTEASPCASWCLLIMIHMMLMGPTGDSFAAW